MEKKPAEALKLSDDVYWIGSNTKSNELQCNPYLLIDGSDAILFDPGSVLDFQEVVATFEQIVPINKITAIIVHHQDPDFCSCIPFLERRGIQCPVITHWRAAVLIKYYGITLPFFHINEHKNQFQLRSGRVLHFIQTPYLHFPGAFVTYDTKNKFLFSSDLFGAINLRTERHIFAPENYMESMKAFHEHYMPGNEIIRPVMEFLRSLDISMILPQHGCIIRENVRDHIECLMELECGLFLRPIKQKLTEIGGYSELLTKIIRRYCGLYPQDEFLSIFQDTPIAIDPKTLRLIKFDLTGEELWHDFFARIYAAKGISWITPLEVLVSSLSKQYSIVLPQVFTTALSTLEKQKLLLTTENNQLRIDKQYLQSSLHKVEKQLVSCPETGFFNESFFIQYIVNFFSNSNQKPASIAFIRLDNAFNAPVKKTDSEELHTIKTISYLLKNEQNEKEVFFRIDTITFALFLIDSDIHTIVKRSDYYREKIAQSTMFSQPKTVSVGCACTNEFTSNTANAKESANAMIQSIQKRITHSQSIGTNRVCAEDLDIKTVKTNTVDILIIDTETVVNDQLQIELEHEHLSIELVKDGLTALQAIYSKTPRCIISELLLPKMDGFLVREQLCHDTRLKSIPFIIASHMKNDETIRHAHSLDILFYLKKPLHITEVSGIIKKIVLR